MDNKENILDFIFEARSEELAKLNEEDKEFLKSPKGNSSKDYNKFTETIEDLPFETKKDILEKFNNFSDTSDYVHAYFYKKYYKMGFSECLKLILECINI